MAAGSYIAARAVVIAASRADVVRARLAAESAVRAAAASWRAGIERGLPLLAERALPERLSLAGGAEGRTIVRRLGADLYLLRGEGRAGAARAHAGALVRVLPIRSLLPPFVAAIAAPRVALEASAVVRVLPPDAPPPGWAAGACDPAAADTLTDIFGAAARPGVASPGLVDAGAGIGGDPPVLPELPAIDTAGFGPLTWDELATTADRTESGALWLGPAAGAGLCDRAAPGNWGAPLDPGSPCADYFPLVYAPGDLRVLGGAGQGVLVVRGRLELSGDARFYGAILAGDLQGASGVATWGALRAGNVSWAGEASYSACTLLRALGRAPALGRPWRAGPRFWLPVF